MQRCLQLAKQGAGNVAPNPMVGAVLVYDGRIIGEGYHKQYGQAHAEVNCIDSVAEGDRALVSKSSMYVSLEPCAHYGKTPPCADLIIEKKIPLVIIGCCDSYKEVDGKGIIKLKTAGVEVITGILEQEALALNERFFTFHEKQRPFIILKWAQSSDGKIANADLSRVFISNESTNRLVHRWRSEEASILVGTNTALHDDPSLTTRLWPGKDPLRLVIDMELRLPASLHLLDGKVATIVFNKLKQEEAGQLSYYKIDEALPVIPQILNALHQLKIQSIIVEGGAKLLQSFIDAGYWDQARIITNEALTIDNGLNAPQLESEKLSSQEKIASNTISFYKNTRNKI